ncbi:MAG: insulinase family protein [Deltaproteobacteria bacterium]|nr:insulinase family protein [Deltaproteobacteria bacterium]
MNRNVVRKALLLILIFFLPAALAVAGEESPGLGVDVQSFTLENGMLFLVVERHTTPQVACRVAVRAGAALEERGRTGIAHMLEHMMFKGTRNFGTLDPERDRKLQEKIEEAYQVVLAERQKRHPDEELIQKKREEMARLRGKVQEIYVPQAFSSHLGKNGAVGVNAFTSKDQTQYLMSVPSDMLELWFSMQSEQIFEPAFREFYVEKEVVQREWAFRYVNSPSGAGWLALDSTLHSAHPYRNPTIGWKSDMERFSTRDAEDYHRTFYNPSNAVAVLVGDVDLEEVKRLAGIYFDRYPAGPRATERVTRDPPQEGPRRVERFLKGARTPLVLIGHHGASMGTEDFYALDVMTMLLSHGRGARMTQNLTRKGLAVSAWAYNPDNRYGGTVILGGTPNDPEAVKEEDLDDAARRKAYTEACRELEGLLLEQVEQLEREPVTRRELDRVKKLARYEFLTRLRSNEELAGTLATMEVQVGWTYLEDYLEKIAQVTPGDVMRVAKSYVREEDRTTCYVIPGGGKTQPSEPYEEVRSFSASTAKEVKRPDDLTNHSEHPTPPGWQHPLSFHREPSMISFPDAGTATVKGAEMFYLPDRELPLVDVTLLVKAGEVDVPEDKIGLADLLDRTLVQGGTRTHGPAELATLLDEHAIQIDVDVNEEVMRIDLSVMREDWETAVEILQEILSQPRFEAEVLEASRRRLLIGLNRQAGDAGRVSRRELEIQHFQGHPYGRDPLKGLDTIPGITREDLSAFLSDYLVPSNMTAAVSGDLSLEEAAAGLEKLLGGLKEAQAPERILAVPEPGPPVLAFIHKPGQVQSQVAMALPGPGRTEPGYWETNLLVDILGGRDSMVFRRLREDLGLVYSAYFHQRYKWKAGWITGFMGCKGDRTAEAIRQAVGLMKDLREEIPPDELKQKRLDALNSFVFNVDTPAALTGVYASYHMRGEPLDTLQRIQESFMEASPEVLRRRAGTYLDPSRLQIVVVGDRSTPVVQEDGTRVNLEESLRQAAGALGLPFETRPLR